MAGKRVVINGKDNIAKFLRKIGVINDKNAGMTAQVLAHSTSKEGKEFEITRDKIFETGLQIRGRNKVTQNSNSNIPSGILSTTVLMNNKDNIITNDGGPLCSFGVPCEIDKNKNFASIVCVLPTWFDEIPLGIVNPDPVLIRGFKTCILDMAHIDKIPPEFILGTSYGNGYDPNMSKLELNPKFYAFSKENKKNAKKALINILGNTAKIKNLCLGSDKDDICYKAWVEFQTEKEHSGIIHNIVSTYNEDTMIKVTPLSEIENEFGQAEEESNR